jgi:hypothetical protein
LLLWIAGVHLVGLVCVAMLLLPVLNESPTTTPNRTDSEGDDGWGRGPKVPPPPRVPPRGGIPLPDAAQSSVRLREAGRISEQLPGRQRRPSREPGRQPGRRPVRSSAASVASSVAARRRP